MKNFTIFFVALITLLCILPANAQRRAREAEKQKTTQKQTTNPRKPTQTPKETNSAGSGRREKRLEPKIPDVPCTQTLNNIPPLRGFSFGQTLSSVRRRFAESQVAITGKNMNLGEKPFVQQYVLYSTGAALGNMTSPNEEYNRKNGIPNPVDYEANTFKNIKEIDLFFYGVDDPILFAYNFFYTPTIAFNSTQAVKEIFLKSHSIPVGSWTPDGEDRSYYNDWNARCKGWRAYFATGVDNTGLYFSVENTDVVSNLDAMRKEAARKKTDEGFKP